MDLFFFFKHLHGVVFLRVVVVVGRVVVVLTARKQTNDRILLPSIFPRVVHLG